MEVLRKLWWIVPLVGVWLVFGGCNRNTVKKSTYRGLKAMEKHEYVRAASNFQDALNLEPEVEDAAELYNLLGLAQWKNTNFDQAAHAFNQSSNLKPSFEAEYNQGLVRKEQGLIPIAEQCFENAVDRNPLDTRAHEMLAALSLDAGDRSRALDFLEAALARVPDSPRVLTSIASVHLQNERPHEAEGALRAAIDKSPTYAPALHNLAVLFDNQAYADNARTYYDRHLSVETEEAWRERSEAALARLGVEPNDEDERAALARARAQEAETVVPPLSGAGSKPRRDVVSTPPSRKTTGMLETAAQAAAEGKTSSAVGICLAAANQAKRSGDMDGAEAATRKAVELVPGNATAHVALARLLEEDNQVREAFQHYGHALEIKPDFNAALIGHARCAMQEFEYGDALKSLRLAVQLKPTDPDVAWMLCDLRRNVIKSERQTRQSLEAFINEFPNDARTLTARTWLREMGPAPAPVSVATPSGETTPAGMRHEVLSIRPMIGDDQRDGIGLARFTSAKTLTPALASVESTAFTTPSSAVVGQHNGPEPTAQEYYEAGLELHRIGDLKQAKDALLNATRLNPKLLDAFLKLGEIYRSQKDDSAEKNCYYKILLIDGENQAARVQLGRAHHRSGNLNEAFMQFDHVVRKTPNNPDLHYYLGDLQVRLNRNIKAARTHYEAFLKLAPDDPRVDTVKDWLQRNR